MDKLSDFKPMKKNPNRHTQRGLRMLEKSFVRVGYVTPMTAAFDGTIIDGNARLETAATKMPGDPIVIHHDGTRPIIAVRDDIKTGDDKRALEIAVAANRTAEVDLDWDIDILKDFQNEGIEIKDFFSEKYFDLLSPKEIEVGEDVPEYLSFVVTKEQRELIESRLDKCDGQNRTEQLINLCLK
jgi:hypothetical protein